MFAESKQLRMIDRIYQSASEPTHWFEFADELSNAYDGAAVVVGMGLAGPKPTHHYFTARLPVEVGPSLLSNLTTGLPFDNAFLSSFTGRFDTLDKVFPDLLLEDTDFYRNWMRPHGLAPVWPIVHVMSLRGKQAPAVLIVFRKQGGGVFTPQELAMGNDLVPHLARAFEIYDDLSGLHRSRRALDEVIDRLRIGVILVDAARRPVLMNRSAQMMLEIGENLGLKRGRICARVKLDNELLQSTLDLVTTGNASRAIRLGEDSAPRDGLQVLVNPLAAEPLGSQVRDATAVLLISGPESFSGLSLRYLRSLYGLTAAEAELLAQLAGGASLEVAAERRGVALNTARSQLKRTFAKTGTRSQSDVIQLVLKCISSVNEV